jgi:phosphoglycerate dehydrogenase-like enzyme
VSNKNILYFDPVSSEFKDVLFEHKPDGFDLLFWEELNAVEKVERAAEVDYLMVATKKVDEKFISSISQAKLIQKTGIGVDNIDLHAASKYALPVSNTPGANAVGVAELTILYILALYRKLPLLNQSTKNGKWLMWELRSSSYEMEGKTHGFIGFGNIGRND